MSNLENINVEKDLELEKIKKEILNKLNDYQKTISYMAADAPLEVLCLSKVTNALLTSNGCLRVYDLFNFDLTKIEGMDSRRIGELTTRLEQFVSM